MAGGEKLSEREAQTIAVGNRGEETFFVLLGRGTSRERNQIESKRQKGERPKGMHQRKQATRLKQRVVAQNILLRVADYPIAEMKTQRKEKNRK